MAIFNLKTSSNALTNATCSYWTSCSTCLSDSFCLWCSSTSTCVEAYSDDFICSINDRVGGCKESTYLLALFLLILSSVVCICMVMLYYRRWQRNGFNRQSTGIMDSIFRHNITHSMAWRGNFAGDGSEWMCAICGCDNKIGASNCILCGTSHTFSMEHTLSREKKQSITKLSQHPSGNCEEDIEYLIVKTDDENAVSDLKRQQEGHLTISERAEAFNFRRLNQLSLRQKIARRRKMWQRVIDPATRKVLWMRAGPAPHANTNALHKLSSENQTEILNCNYLVGTVREALLGKHHNTLHNVSSNGDDDDPAATLLRAHAEGRDQARSLVSASNLPSQSYLGDALVARDSFDDSAYISNSPAYVSVVGDDDELQWESAPVASTWKHSGVQLDQVSNIDDVEINLFGDDSDELDLRAAAALPFGKKQLWFVKRISQLQQPWTVGFIRIEVHRSRLLAMSHSVVMSLDPDSLRRNFRITFLGEPGLDAGGLSREWFNLVTQQLLEPCTGLFTCNSGESLGYHINPLSSLRRSDHLTYFQFAGRVFGKAMLEQQAIPANFSLPIRKQILGLPISFRDLEFVDVGLYQSLLWLKNSPAADIENLCLDFTVAYDNDGTGEFVIHELKPGGANISVTGVNRDEYLTLRLQHRVMNSVKPQLSALLKGLFEVLPRNYLQVFDYQELDLLICGMPAIDVDDWAAHTDYQGVYGSGHKVVQWFWESVRAMSQEERARLLQYATGSSRLPAQGFRALQSSDGNYRRFNLQSITKLESLYPRAHTCFNKLDLPLYSSAAELDAYLSVVIHMEVSGFNMK